MPITKINDEGSEFDDAGPNLRRFQNRDDTMRWAIMARVQVVMAKDEGIRPSPVFQIHLVIFVITRLLEVHFVYLIVVLLYDKCKLSNIVN